MLKAVLLLSLFCQQTWAEEPNLLEKQIRSRSQIVQCVEQSENAQLLIDREKEIGKVGGYVNTGIIRESSAVIVDCRSEIIDAYNAYRSAGGLKTLAAIKLENSDSLAAEWHAAEAARALRSKADESRISNNQTNNSERLTTDRIPPKTEVEKQLSAEDTDLARRAWASQIAQTIRLHHNPVSTPKGPVFIKINLAQTGEVISATTSQSSGDSQYDESSIRAVFASSPFPLPANKLIFDPHITICLPKELCVITHKPA